MARLFFIELSPDISIGIASSDVHGKTRTFNVGLAGSVDAVYNAEGRPTRARAGGARTANRIHQDPETAGGSAGLLLADAKTTDSRTDDLVRRACLVSCVSSPSPPPPLCHSWFLFALSLHRGRVASCCLLFSVCCGSGLSLPPFSKRLLARSIQRSNRDDDDDDDDIEFLPSALR